MIYKLYSNNYIMSWRPIYLGRNSVFCIKENKCIPNINKPGVDTLKEAKAIIRSILRDLKRGYTYNHYGEVIPMDRRLAIRRLNFLLLLAKKHGLPEDEYKLLKMEIQRAERKVKELEIEALKEKAEIKSWSGIKRRQKALSF
jgi:hypothetical protein